MEFLFYATLFIFIMVMGFLYGSVDYDFWARLIVGKTFFQTGEVLKNDFMSYAPSHPWYDHEWGSSLLFYWTLDHFGEVGLFFLKGILVFLTFFLVVQIIKLRYETRGESKPYLSFLYFFFAIHATMSTLFSHVRCQAITFLFFALWLYILERVRHKKEYYLLWIMPFTMLVWVNSHGGCATGFGIFALYIFGELLDKKPIKKYLIAFVASILVTFINPYGFEYLKYLLLATTMKREGITEWRSTFSQDYMLKLFKFKLYLSFILLVVGVNFIKTFLSKRFWVQPFFADWWKKCDKVKLLIMAVMFVLGLKAVRFMPYFVICASAFCYEDFYKLFNKKMPDIANKIKDITLFVLVIIAFYGSYIKYGGFLSSAVNAFPVAEIEYISQQGFKGNLMTFFHHGSYAMYKLYPDVYLYMDGRYEEIYQEGVIDTLGTIMEKGNVDLPNGEWKQALNKYHTDMIILSKSMPTYNALLNDKNWELLVRTSGDYALFGRKGKYKNAKNLQKIYTSRELDEKKFETKLDWWKD